MYDKLRPTNTAKSKYGRRRITQTSTRHLGSMPGERLRKVQAQTGRCASHKAELVRQGSHKDGTPPISAQREAHTKTGAH